MILIGCLSSWVTHMDIAWNKSLPLKASVYMYQLLNLFLLKVSSFDIRSIKTGQNKTSTILKQTENLRKM